MFSIKRLWRQLKRGAVNAPLMCLSAFVAISIDAFAVLSILAQNQHTVSLWGLRVPIAPFEAGVSTGFTLLAILVRARAAQMNLDQRPEVKRRSFPALCLSFYLILPSAYYAGQGYALGAQQAVHETYIASPEYPADQALVNDHSADPVAVDAARARLRQAAPVIRADFDFLSFMFAYVVLAVNMQAVGMARLPKPETEAEAKRRHERMRQAKRRATLEANKKAKAKAESPVPNVVKLLKTGLAR